MTKLHLGNENNAFFVPSRKIYPSCQLAINMLFVHNVGQLLMLVPIVVHANYDGSIVYTYFCLYSMSAKPIMMPLPSHSLSLSLGLAHSNLTEQ